MNSISMQKQQCLETWISCEGLLAHLLAAGVKGMDKIVKTIDECAHICMETWQAIKSRSAETPKLVLLCIGICEECAEVCEHQPCLQMKQCGKLCRTCADSLAQLTLAAVYN